MITFHTLIGSARLLPPTAVAAVDQRRPRGYDSLASSLSYMKGFPNSWLTLPDLFHYCRDAGDSCKYLSKPPIGTTSLRPVRIRHKANYTKDN